MSATKLHAAGYTALVSVVPPGAPISPRSKIDPSQRGKCPGKHGGNGWYGYDFLRADPPTTEDAAAWDNAGANVGLLGEFFPGLDIDSEDARLTKAVRRLAVKHLGAAPVRTSREPRSLLVYRTSEPFNRIYATVTFAEKEHRIEMLGRGRQYLVHGKHPSGSDYGWDGKPLWTNAPDSLATVTAAQVEGFFAALQEALGEKGIQVTIGRETREEMATPVQEALLAPSLEALRDTVALVPNGFGFEDRESYITMGHAIKAASAGEGLDIFVEWASRWEDGVNDPDTVERDWHRMQPPFRVGWDWIEDRAREHGYSPAWEEFEADPTATEEPDPRVALGITGVLDFSDEWVVRLIEGELKDALRYIPGTGENGVWLLWNGHRWVDDRDMAYERLIRSHLAVLARKLAAWADAQPTAKDSEPISRAARRCQSATGIASVVRLLRARVACTPDDFDTDPWELNTPGGVYDLRLGTRRDCGGLFRRAAALAPKRGPHPVWDHFLDDLTAGDDALKRYLQKVIGYTLTGSMNAKAFWFLWGSESNTGKSTFVRVLQGIMGTYSATADVETFTSDSKGKLMPRLAQLPGVRLVTAAEPSAGRVWDEERVKQITGHDAIETRLLYGQPFTYVPQFKIMVIGNHEPALRQLDSAMRQRIHIVPFNIPVPKEKRNPHLSAELVEYEGAAILQWAIDGCLLWQQEGLTPPAVVVERTEAYAEGQDIFGEWLEEACEMGSDFEAARLDLYEHWSTWCHSRGERPGKLRSFKTMFEDRVQVEEARLSAQGARVRGYKGIRLNPRAQAGTEAFNL